MKIATWNVEWATPRSSKGKRIQEILRSLEADVIVLTEGNEELLPPGHIVDAGTDWGYTPKSPRNRKVLLWSRYQLSDVRTQTSRDIPSGRFVSACVTMPDGIFTVCGVCIPWKDAHVRSGRCDRAPWQDHVDFVAGLHEEIRNCVGPLVVAGDFNQRFPRGTQPLAVFEALRDCCSPLELHSVGLDEKPLIDHIATTNQFSKKSVEVIPDHDESGKLSDHRGISILFDFNL